MSNTNDVVDKARVYYDSDDADNFYFHVWGGEDIHIGLYQSDDEPIRDASHRTVQRMIEKIQHLPEGAKVLDIGAGYGGSARVMAREKKWHVTALNLSVVQNNRDRQMNKEQGLDDLIDVVDGSFEDLPFEDNSFDAVWSQDSILHSGNRKTVFAEVDRVLKPGGDFVFTDPMQKPGVEPEVLEPVLARIHLANMGSVEDYTAFAKDFGWEIVEVEEMPEKLVMHYSSVLRELEKREDELKDVCSSEYREKMKTGLRHWINAGKKDALNWGILHFRKSR
jgi:sarcosine/dimethylglycine N-methyltransferase